MKYPETLYVTEEQYYPYLGLTHLVGKAALESAVPDNNRENEVAVYQLVSVGKFKKTVTKTSVVEQVKS